jgi:hypothetical protein
MSVTAVLAGLFSHDWGVLCPEWLQTANAASPLCFAVNTDFMGALSQVGQDFDITGRNFSQVGVFLALSGLLTFVMPDLGILRSTHRAVADSRIFPKISRYLLKNRSINRAYAAFPHGFPC